MITNLNTKIDSGIVHYEPHRHVGSYGYTWALTFYRPDSTFVFWSVKLLKIVKFSWNFWQMFILIR